MIRDMISARGRVGRVDLAIAIGLSALGVALMIANVDDKTIHASPAAVPLFLLLTLPLVWRRGAPLLALGVVLPALAVHIALFGNEFRCGVLLPVIYLLGFAAGARLDRRDALVGLGLVLAVLFLMATADNGTSLSTMPFFAPVGVLVWGIGRVAHSRGRLAGELRHRTAELRTARDERARMEVATDRARMSAELDELLNRRLGDLARLAESGARSGGDAAAASATLAQIETESRRTLEQMRALVGALRDDGADAPLSPQPTLTYLEAMLLHAKGADARLVVEGDPRVLPASVELTAYRVVETLLGALEDAPDVEVRVRFGDDALELAVSGPVRRRDASKAIERARERVALHRGTLEATLRAGRAEAVAHLPVTAGA